MSEGLTQGITQAVETLKKKLCKVGFTWVLPTVITLASIGVAYLLGAVLVFDSTAWLLMLVCAAIAFGIGAASFEIVVALLAIALGIFTYNWALFSGLGIFDFAAWMDGVAAFIGFLLVNVFTAHLGAIFGRVGRDIFDYYSCRRA